jgi:hypothetical protein
VHFDGNGIAGFDSTSTRHSTVVDITSDVVGCNVLQRAVRLGQTNAYLALVDAIDPEFLEGCVGGDARGG